MLGAFVKLSPGICVYWMNRLYSEFEMKGVDIPERELLRRRARRLARRQPEESAKGQEVLEFRVGGDRYALPVTTLREIQPVGKLATLPGSPDFVLGVILIRGHLVSVLDLRHLLGLTPTRLSDESYAVVLENETMVFSLLANEVGEVGVLSDEAARDGEPSLETIGRRYLSAITKNLVVIDGEALLSDPALVVSG